MKTAAPPYSALANLLASLYPREFQAEFGDEMRTVFTRSMLEAGSNGAWASLRVLARELADLPVNLLREHLRAAGRKERWIMNRLSPSHLTRAGQLGALGYGLGFALLGLFFSTLIVSQAYLTRTPFPLAAVWIAASFIAGGLGGLCVGLGVSTDKKWTYALLGGAALALANLAAIPAERLGLTWYLLNMKYAEFSFGYSFISALLVGPLTGFFFGLLRKSLRRGLILAGVGEFGFILGFIASMFAALTVIQGEAGLYSDRASALPPTSFTVVMVGVFFMALTGAIAGAILGRCVAEMEPDLYPLTRLT